MGENTAARPAEWLAPASSGEGEILSRRWAAAAPCAVLLLAHGMAEHSGRYHDTAQFFAGQGVSMYANDHAGHGPTAETYGHFAGAEGWESVLRDMHRLHREAAAQNPGLPVFLLGHSMGSFIARGYLTRWGEGLCGCMLSGTMGPNPAAGFGRVLARTQMALLGPKSPGRLLDRLATAGYLKRIERPASRNAWLTSSAEAVRAYDADPHCGFVFTAKGYYEMMGGLREVSTQRWAGAVPHSVPILLYAGEEDPVGRYGEGPRWVYDALRAAGHPDVTLTLYPGARHEPHNEPIREQVWQDVLHWLNARLPQEGGADA